MRIRTSEALFNYLDADLAWRKKELTYIKSSIFLASDSIKPLHIRLGILLVYAHWQGYIKNVGSWYVNYLKHKNLNYCDLKENFIALSLKSKIKECGQANKTSIHSEIVNILINELSSEADFPHKDGIDTTSNLKYEILNDILFTLGLDDSKYKLKEKLIDFKLLESRNRIAHGERYVLNERDFLEIYNNVLEMLELFKDQIIDAVENETYKK